MTRSNNESSFREHDFEQLIAAAKAGSNEALGRLVEWCRPYLMLVANQDLGPQLRTKFGASDIVQETLFTAQNSIEHFRGSTEQELLGWLRGILVNDLLESQRKFRGTAKRQIDREVPLAGDRGRNEPPIDVVSDQVTPGTDVALREQAEQLGRAIRRLPEDYQLVVRLRNWEQMSFGEIGIEMNRSAEAVRKLWSRAIGLLERELESDE